MKTVMKKMFSLLLVAVLMVSAVPVAFAAEEASETPTCSQHVGSEISPREQSEQNQDPTCTQPGKKAWRCLYKVTDENGVETEKGHVFTTEIPATGHTEVIDAPVPATCTTEGKTEGKHCSVCQEVLVAQETIPALDHDYGTGSICSRCNNCKLCNKIITTAADHDARCVLNPTYETLCTKCNTKYITADGHPVCGVCDGCHTTANCPYCSVCWPKDQVTSHKASDHCEKCKSLDHDTADHCTECGKTDGTHKTDCSHYVSSGTSKVKIYANLYTGDVLTKTVPLVVYNEDPNTSISDSITEHKDLIYAELEDQYSGYSWSGNVYDSENEDGENMNSKVGKGINVHINVHSKENIVYLYVHNARTYDRIGIVRLHGKKVGEAVKESEVRKAVKEYFSFSSLKMYDTEKWDLYVDGKDVKSDDTLTVGSNHYVIDVKISGSAKNTSGAKADSSNPKTGDAIFAPAAVLGLSATTLAVLFYLNKKRAY